MQHTKIHLIHVFDISFVALNFNKFVGVAGTKASIGVRMHDKVCWSQRIVPKNGQKQRGFIIMTLWKNLSTGNDDKKTEISYN